MLHRNNAMTEPRNENDSLPYVVYSRRWIPPLHDDDDDKIPSQADENYSQLNKSNNNKSGGFHKTLSNTNKIDNPENPENPENNKYILYGRIYK